MSVIELALTEGPLAAAYLLAMAALAFGVVPVTPARLRVARNCFWASCIIFAGIAIMWGITTDFALWPRVLIVGVLTGLAGIAAVESARFIMHEQGGGSVKPLDPPPSPAPQPVKPAAPLEPQVRGPTLEATGHSSIDATGAEIPADLPFQLGRADDHSRIDMPGLKIVPQADGSLKIIPGETSLSPPTREYASLTVAQIKARINAISGELLIFENQFESEFWTAARENPSNYKPAAAVREKYETIFQENFLNTAQSLTSACLLKIGGRFDSSNLSNIVQHGAITIRNGHFASHTPGKDVAAFLQAISAALPRS